MLKNLFVIVLFITGFHITSYARVYGEDSTNQHYGVGVDDVLEISVLGHDDLRTVAPITSDGSISFPYIGSINVKGMSLAEIEQEIAKKLSSGYIKYPTVFVTLAEYKSNKFFVYGEVKSPGKFMFEGEMTVSKAISEAGGITAEGIYGIIKVKRKQKDTYKYKEIVIDLENNESYTNGDMPIDADDIVIVERNKEFFIYGEVKNPGKFTLEENITVVKAISKAGGMTPNGIHGRIVLKRKQKDKNDYKEILIDLTNKKEERMSGDTLIQADDILVVERNKEFFVYGEVRSPGKFMFEREMTVLKAISEAGGITADGIYGVIKVKRKQNGTDTYKEIVIDLKNKEGYAKGDMTIEADDILVVERNKEFFVYGEVENPGKFTLEDNMTVLKAISIAGGLSKYGSSDKVKILRKRQQKAAYESIKVDVKDALKGQGNEDVLLEADDIVVVSEGML
ncbi:MAG: SLBB domain-containing protein [Candidatus Brocadiaceae bacterium]|nr:SLBB domain-containing protein [Candidatus Brocadiaceae bacterium]